ncbi:hypothetical protein ACS0TY_006175 [Phlomoides rotata]
MMYDKHPDRGMTEIGSHDVDFLEKEYPIIGEVNDNLELYELQDPENNLRISGKGGVSQSNPAINRNQESHPKSVGVTHWTRTLKTSNSTPKTF